MLEQSAFASLRLDNVLPALSTTAIHGGVCGEIILALEAVRLASSANPTSSHFLLTPLTYIPVGEDRKDAKNAKEMK
ncbi:MAG: hypothetical protein R6X15_07405 [Pseudomonadota bacterium]